MKNGVDKADLEKGIKLPCILIENKVDLLKEDNEKDSKELEEFSKKNGFDGCFRTSAKTGKNINEALNYLICDNIKRREIIKLNKDNSTKIEKEKSVFFIDKNNNETKLPLLDVSYYKEKLYLYFGITPILLFYLPFNLVTNCYLTDKFLVFILSCLIFLIYLFLINKISKNIIKKIPINIFILSIFIIGFCNILQFIVIRTAIYEVAITTAHFLLLLSLCLFYFYIDTNNLKKQYILNFFISLTLCLSVGARPHYVFFVPIFLFFIIYLKHSETKNINDTLKTTLIFLIPCFIYGTVIALYNYLRFDSIFEFGFKYQINNINHTDCIFTLKNLIVGLKHNLFQLPNMNETTIFSLSETSGNTIGSEDITGGIIWTCPFIFILFFIPNFLMKIYKINKKNFTFILLIILITTVNIIAVNFFGMVIRFVFEYLSLMILLSVIIFLFYISEQKEKSMKYFLNIIFVIMFAFSVFINISLLFCKENFATYWSPNDIKHGQIVKYLF